MRAQLVLWLFLAVIIGESMGECLVVVWWGVAGLAVVCGTGYRVHHPAYHHSPPSPPPPPLNIALTLHAHT